MHTVFCRALQLRESIVLAIGRNRAHSANKVKFRYSTGQRLRGLDHTDLGPKAALVENRPERSSTPNQLILKFKLSPLSFFIIVNTFRPRYTSDKAEAGTESRRSRGFDTRFLGEIIEHLD